MINWIVSSSLLIAVVIALRYLLRGKLHPAVQYALWGLVLLRLLLPFTVAHNPVSISSAVERAPLVSTLVQDMERLEYVTALERDADGAVLGQLPDTMRPDGTVQQSHTKIADSADEATFSRWQLMLTLCRIVKPLWRMGIAAVLLWLVGVNAVFGIRLRRSRTRLAYDGKLRVYVTDSVKTPCLVGLLSPAVYVTPEVAENKEALRHVAAHEYTHYRHGDHVWSWLRGVVLALHWYNPLVWWAAALSRRDAELACDAGAIHLLGESQRGDYGRTLIGLSCQRTVPSTLLTTATTMTGGKRSLRERIRLIAQKPQTKAAAAFAVIVIAVFVAVLTFTGSAPRGSYLRWSPRNISTGLNYRTHYASDVNTVIVHVEEYCDGALITNEVTPYTGNLAYLSVRFYSNSYDENGEIVNIGHTRVMGNGGKAFDIDVPYAGDWGSDTVDPEDAAVSFVQWYPRENTSFTAGTKFTFGIYASDSASFDPLSIPSYALNDTAVDAYRAEFVAADSTGHIVLVWAEFADSANMPGDTLMSNADSNILGSSITGWCDASHTHTTAEGNAEACYCFNRLKKATLSIQLYKNGVLVQEGHKQVRSITYLEDEIHTVDTLPSESSPTGSEGSGWYATVLSNTNPNLDLAFNAEGIPHFSHYLDGCEYGIEDALFELTPGETYYIATAAWGEDNGYFCNEYRDDPNLLAKPDVLVVFAMEVLE